MTGLGVQIVQYHVIFLGGYNKSLMNDTGNDPMSSGVQATANCITSGALGFSRACADLAAWPAARALLGGISASLGWLLDVHRVEKHGKIWEEHWKPW